MNPLAIPMAVAIALILAGIGLMLWADFRAWWQRGESYDSAFPFAVGSICLIAGWVLGIAAEIFYLISGA